MKRRTQHQRWEFLQERICSTTLLLAFVALVPVFAEAQESLLPLEANKALHKAEQHQMTLRSSQISNTFRFSFDTLKLPFFDDFSRDKFTYRDVNELHQDRVIVHRLFEVGNPVAAIYNYSDDTTYSYTYYKGQNGKDSVASKANAFVSLAVRDLCSYPEKIYDTVKAWPNISVVDSFWNPGPKTVNNGYAVYNQDSLHVVTPDLLKPEFSYQYVDSTFYRIWKDGKPVSVMDEFMVDTTYSYYFTHKNISGVDTVVIDTVANSSVKIDLCALTNYPIACSELEVWPNLRQVDTVRGKDTSTTIGAFGLADYLQKDILMHFVCRQARDTQYLWQDNNAYLNSGFSADPMSVGVATFDGLDADGYPYDFNSNKTRACDYLTSKPINLYAKPDGSGAYGTGDSVYLSFFYERGGVGEVPDRDDSLVVQFYNVDKQIWTSVWSDTGTGKAEPYEFASIRVMGIDYFKNGFQFRFVNYGAPNGMVDVWNIDYVELGDKRIDGYKDSIYVDLAWKYPITTLLKGYTAIPWNHYQTSTNIGDRMRIDIPYDIQNNSNQTLTWADTRFEVLHDNVSVGTELLSQSNNINAKSNFVQNMPVGSFQFNPNQKDTSAYFDVQLNFYEQSGGTYFINDTVNFTQVFEDYYSYDDGTAELAYGLKADAGAKLAYQFTSEIEDTLVAVDIYFAPSVNDASNEIFQLTVWDHNGSGPGQIVHENKLTLGQPSYDNGRNGFVRYYIEPNDTIVIGNTFYVGWQQGAKVRINVGFDLHADHSNRIFYNLGNGFSSTSFKGALMIRPIFKNAVTSLVNVEEQENLSFKIYPNPSSDQFMLSMNSDSENYNVTVFDISGQLIEHREHVRSHVRVNTTHWNAGVYLVKVTDERGGHSTRKLIVQH